MREKIGALIQFLAVVISFAMMFIGIGGAYNEYFGADGLVNSAVILWTIIYAVVAVVGAVVGVVGVLIGNLMKR